MKIGRPKAQIPRLKDIHLRVTDFEFKKIARVAKEKNLTKTEAVLQEIDLLERDKPKKFKNIIGTNQKHSLANIDDDDD